MNWLRLAAITVLGAGIVCACALAQSSADGPPPAAAVAPDSGPVPLEWTPPALAALSAQAAMKSSFTLDRTLLAAASSLLPDSDNDARQSIAKLDGVSVHTLRFADSGMIDPGAVESIRDAYHLRGWKHLVSTTNSGGPVHNGTTDVWVVLDGATVRGAVVLAETPKSVTLVTIAGNLNPVDIFRLRGHFGIPKFDTDNQTQDK
jgi:Domain of unknown function (DUF4252)